MPNLDQMLRAHPIQPSTLELIGRCVAACSECSDVCTCCADACLAEEQVGELRECIRLDLDCAAVCQATGSVVARLTRPHKAPMAALLEACIEACRACGAECEKHAAMHEHCRVCAAQCRACEQACADLLEAIP